MMIYIGADHGGYDLKESLKEYMKEKNIEFVDVGTDSDESVDYPDYAEKVVSHVLKEENSRGVLVCGSGTGMYVAANRHKGIRATTAYSDETAQLSREHNNSNIITFGGRTQKEEDVKRWFQIWYDTPFSEAERHKRRLAKLDE